MRNVPRLTNSHLVSVTVTQTVAEKDTGIKMLDRWLLTGLKKNSSSLISLSGVATSESHYPI